MGSNLFVIDDWRRELTAEDHVQRQHLAKTSLQRNFRGDAQRRVTSSSASSSMAVVDCCWARGHRAGGAAPALSTALSTYLFCALSGGALCILNTTNFMKMYLFDGDSSRRNRSDDHAQRRDASRQHDSRRERLAAIDSVLLPQRGKKEPAASGTTPEGDEFSLLVCAAAEGWLCLFTVEPDASSHTRSAGVRTGAVHKAVELPSDDAGSGKGTWEKAYVRFSPKGRRVVAVVSARVPCSKAATAPSSFALAGESVEYVTLFCVLKWQEGEALETYAVESSWTSVRAPSRSASAGLKHVGWWDDEDSTLLTAWSDGTVSLLDAKLETVAHTSIFSTPAEEVAGRVSMVAAAAPGAQSKGSSGRVFAAQQAGLLAMVLDGNIVMVFTVHDPQQHCGAADEEGPLLKVARLETTKGRTETGGEFTLRPGHHTYCSEDIPVADLALFDNFIPYTLAVLLQSGALLALDTVTMELLYHRPLQRLFPPRGGRAVQQTGDKHQAAVAGDGKASRSSTSSGRGTDSANYFIRPKERPMAMCVVEHNTVVFLRPS
ncbi:uncharacterized protein Tco025E_07080 [Trypanosoma conorhini]|uniref:Uncharacterized protein n=1 Tax=Trypanosoma conorhini TaxID=83891 RepID=A0A422NTI6_9TRYP|nr:uncharacterized protein Tco025E_07080 [Trypanosoma conorhini]RNF08778.1 hypothetical protein Tco025E_07080 [Trypanosoma conorhini]